MELIISIRHLSQDLILKCKQTKIYFIYFLIHRKSIEYHSLFQVETKFYNLLKSLFIFQQIQMKRRGNWKIQQQHYLKYLVQEKKLKRWNIIAKLINKKCNFLPKTGKQCREKWFNSLNPQLKNNQWTKQEQDLLFKIQSEKGCRWIQISKTLQGRSQNNIKNHYYNTLRKIIRKINNYRKIFKIKRQKISNYELNTILSISQSKNSLDNSQLVQKCQYIKNTIIEFNHFQIQNNQFNAINKLTQLIDSIHQSSKLHKQIFLSKQPLKTISKNKIQTFQEINNLLDEVPKEGISNSTNVINGNQTPFEQQSLFEELAISPLRQMSELFSQDYQCCGEINYVINF